MTKYEQYSTEITGNVPLADMEVIITVFIKEAEMDMGSVLDAVAYPRVIEMIVKDFKYLPVYSVGGAFKKGSLGQLGPGRLVPRTIYGWLAEMSQVYFQRTKHIAETIDEKIKWDGIKNYPLGSAIGKKIDWFRIGKINIDDWDKIPIKELSDRINKKLDIFPELWGVKSKNNESQC